MQLGLVGKLNDSIFGTLQAGEIFNSGIHRSLLC